MAKEEKNDTFGNGIPMDLDAAELLKDLEDDDDEEELSEEISSDANRLALARMISSRDSLVGLSTVKELPAVSPVITVKPSLNRKDGEDSLAEGLLDEVAGEQPSEEPAEDVRAPSESEFVQEEASPEVAVPETVPAEKSVMNHDVQLEAPKPIVMKNSGMRTSIKPPVELGLSREGLRPVPASTEDRQQDVPGPKVPESGETQRPMMPPPPPMGAASIVSKGRILREGETAYSAAQLRDMQAGGRNDEAPDLAQLKTGDNGWYTQIFNEDYLRTIPKSEPRQTRREARFIMDRLGLEGGARVLDLACGTGRHTIELAKAGFDMVGLDYSMVMLKHALASAQAAKQVIKFIHGDMLKLSFKAIFDAVYCVQTSFGYFDDLRNFRVLQGIYRALKPGGVFLIEVMNRDFLVDDLPLRLWWKGIECKLLEEIDLDHQTGVLMVQRSFVFDDQTRAPWEQKINIRLYSSAELRALLMRAGFEVVELSGDYSLPGAFFGATSPKIIYVAEKRVIS